MRQPDGKVLVAAAIPVDPFPARVALVRFKRNGEPDATFGRGGRVRVGAHWNFLPLAVDLQPDGRIVLLGRAGYGYGFYPVSWPTQVGLIRLLPDGSRDRTFGNNGFVAWGPPRRHDTAQETASPGLLLSQADGRLLVALSVSGVRRVSNYPLRGFSNVSFSRVAFVRFNENGSVDESFGPAGLVEQPEGPPNFGTWAALLMGTWSRWAGSAKESRPSGGFAASQPTGHSTPGPVRTDRCASDRTYSTGSTGPSKCSPRVTAAS